MKTVKKATSILVYALIVVVVLVVGGVYAAGRFGYMAPITPYVVMSGSMEPSVTTGSVVLVQAKPFGYAVGDVITFNPNASKDAVTHRVNGLMEEDGQIAYQTKGDANKTPDNGSVDREEVVGGVFLTLPYLGYGVNFAKQPYGFILLVIVPATIIVYEELKNIGSELVRALRRDKKRTGAKEYTSKDEPARAPLPEPEVIEPVPIVYEAPPKPSYVPNAPLPPVKYAAAAMETPEVVEQELPEMFAAAPKQILKEVSRGGFRWLMMVPTAAAIALFVGVTGSFLMDNEVSFENILGAAETFATPNQLNSSPSKIADTLVINEVMPDALCSNGQSQNESQEQWLELYNGTDDDVNLNGYILTDGTTDIDLVTANSLIVPKGELALLAHNNIWGANKCFADNGAVTGNLGGTLDINTGFLQLLDSNREVIDTVKWRGDTGLNPSQNESIERAPTGWDSALGTAFEAGDFMKMTPPSPGL